MTLDEYKNEIKELRERLEKLETAKVEEPQSKWWEPNENERYWVSDNVGNVDNVRWDNDRFDNWHYLTGNCFKTKEEAEEYKKQIEYTARYKNYIEEHSEPIDWKNKKTKQYYARFDYLNTVIQVDYVSNCRFQGTIYASSETIIRDAIKEIGVDNFMEYVLGVK